MIEVSGSTLTQAITFSAPVRNPLLAVLTLGDYYQTTTWTFDATPMVLSTGPGIVNMNGTLTASGQGLVGGESNGVVQFPGRSPRSASRPPRRTTACSRWVFAVGSDVIRAPGPRLRPRPRPRGDAPVPKPPPTRTSR